MKFTCVDYHIEPIKSDPYMRSLNYFSLQLLFFLEQYISSFIGVSGIKIVQILSITISIQWCLVITYMNTCFPLSSIRPEQHSD